jgi:cytochrome c-type biogenesis protein CcmH
MFFWFIAIAVTVIACAALFYAAGPRAVNVTSAEPADANSHLRQVLAGIDADQAAGKLGEAEAVAAKGELAREVLRLKAESAKVERSTRTLGNAPLLAGIGGVAVLALGLYAVLGSPNMESQPLAARPEITAQKIDLGTAIGQIETALAANPDDLRGWVVIAPAYMEMRRFSDAVKAYRRIVELEGPTLQGQLRLAEALMFEAEGKGSDEAVTVLRAAAASAPEDELSRLYLAAELTRQGKFDEAVTAWNDVLAMGKGDETWYPAARQGLLVAQNNGEMPADEQQNVMIAQMVTGLQARLDANGGSIEEWTQLVRAYLVLNDKAKAQAAVDAALLAYPKTFDRGEIETLALGAGLTLNGAKP